MGLEHSKFVSMMITADLRRDSPGAAVNIGRGTSGINQQIAGEEGVAAA